ncbi:chromosome-associated kinesin KIF4A isoform X2 [Tribolium castaneum]|uniref:chromosome-associated kinesin KIF4A isoform X2 n=1 Tax=Tribolium castaneum TaxID=7070 RepID=UPI00077DC28D|nr:PREDICTED: chromosome-associated kinesin KIF4A isoform X2 [Tribolium castaneum]|eukprot:XP_015836868.1 PREDICTED: chromosome-associated kinesin KIF4A isoform X2 [Tribolium castaneum]
MSDKSVQVALRIRPLVPSEISKGCKNVFEVYPSLNQVKIKNTDKAFTYNYVFEPSTTQDYVYETCVKGMIENLFNGYNVTVLAYGQTGSGKTHTMGTTYNGEGEMGVIPRAITEIFNTVRENFVYDVSVTVSFVELYQETLYDLLAEKSRDQCILDIREDPSKGVVIPGLTQVQVDSTQSVFQALIRGSSSRATGATNMNAQSSRSHAIFSVNMTMINKKDGNEKTAKFHLVDLAGSERPKKTGAVGTTFKEGVNINKGLLVLGNVISALADEKQQHGYISYRDSNLTRLLKDSLGGNSITLMIACVSPADYNIDESISTLRYADRARRIQNKPIVNQDPKAAEINLLKKTIQDLKLQIVGQGGPAVSSNELTSLREENVQLHTRIRDLTVQLSSTLHDNTGLLEKLMILQNANENLHKKIQELKQEYDLTLDNINLTFTQNDSDGFKKNLAKLQQIQEQFTVLDYEQKKTEDEIFHHETNIDNIRRSQEGKYQNVDEMSKDQENYTKQQMALNTELQELTKQLAMKEHLARQITTNTQYLVDYEGLKENENKILQLQKEKDELLQQLKNAHSNGPSSKIAEQRRKRVQELENQLQELNRKVQEQARLIKLKEKDVTKINQLNNEIQQMKQTRVKLIRKMREESERFRTWKIKRERDIAKLKQEDRKKQTKIVRMEAMHNKQQNVLRRKVEEAVALNKRLKDALALRKATQDAKNSGKNEKIGCWMRQEFDVHMHLIEAEATLKGLLDDRATLQQQLDKLRDDPENLDESQVQEIESDIEMRSVQIQDLQQKLLDSEEENKKSKFDNIQTMGEAKFAIKILLEQAADIKASEVSAKNKMIETQAALGDFKHKCENLEKVVKIFELKNNQDLAQLQKDYEEKIAVLLRQLRGVEVQDGSEELKQRCAIQSEQIENLERKNQELMEKLHETQQQAEELKEKIDTISLAKESQIREAVAELNTPVENMRRKKIKIKREFDSTFTMENQENFDVSMEELDDIANDPDWKRTPIGKWVLENKRRTNAGVENMALKRTSDGGCMCVKSNCSKRCGCKKLNRSCTVGCRCSSTNCTNRDKIAETTGSLDEKKRRMVNQNLFANN